MPLAEPNRTRHLFLGLTLFAAVVFVFSCRPAKPVPVNEMPVVRVTEAPDLVLEAHAYPYDIAMGKGRGVIFRVNVIHPRNLDSTQLHIDTLYVANKPLPVIAVRFSDSLCKTEASYKKMMPEPEPGVPPVPVMESPDDILYLHSYYPASLVVRYKGVRYQLPIEHFDIHPH
jgi:hypothetical protein